MKNETKQPLYKVLNEQRTQGECLSANNGKALLQKGHNRWDKIAEFEHEPTTQYTALAVNNLHILAEALEGALKTINTLAGELNYQSTRWDNEHIKPIKEALNRIS